MPSTPTWRFRTIEEDQKHVEPTHREHLAPGGAVEPLVREAIQNSLDVTTEGQPTKVTFTLGSANAADARPYFEDLRPHLEAISRSLPEGLPPAGDPVRFLAIEDYNTTGLVGDPTVRKEIHTDGTKNHFFRFWHRIGPASEFKRRGSWGVGKVVFSNASQIRTFFGVTLRSDDASPLLMGEAGLTIHTLPQSDTDYDWYGYYATHEVRRDNEGREKHFILPVQDLALVRQFSELFSVTRPTPGLSIVVPYIREEVTLENLAKAVIEQYFLPIMSGRLEVSACEGARQIHITHATIDDVVNELTWSTGASSQSEIAALLRLARWQISLPIDNYTLLNAEGVGGRYALGKDRFPDGAFVRTSDDFATNKRIALRIPVQVSPAGGTASEEEIRLVLERDETLRTSNVPHLRSGINISKMRSQGAPGVRGMLVVGIDPDSQGALDKLLQASEGPAHMNWEQRGEGYDKAKSLYDDAFKAIGFMRHLVRKVVELLAAPQEERDTRTLSAFFPDYSDVGNADGSGQGQRRGPGPKDPGAPPPLPPGVLECVVRALVPGLRAIRPVDTALIQLCRAGQPDVLATTGEDGSHRFAGLSSGEYEVLARKDDLGEARISVTLPSDVGVHIELLLRPAALPKLFTKLRLDDGFAIRGNPDFTGVRRPIRVRLAYAAWGGSKSYNPADFSLGEPRMAITFTGVQEGARSELVVAPNVLRFTPVTSDFHVEVRGFDVNRGLHVDARTVDDLGANGGDE